DVAAVPGGGAERPVEPRTAEPRPALGFLDFHRQDRTVHPRAVLTPGAVVSATCPSPPKRRAAWPNTRRDSLQVATTTPVPPTTGSGPRLSPRIAPAPCASYRRGRGKTPADKTPGAAPPPPAC